MGDLSRRLDELSGRIGAEEAERIEGAKPNMNLEGVSNYNKSLQLIAEFVAGPLVGGLLGYGLDYLFGTLPVFLIILLLLGFGAGVLNMTRATKNVPAIGHLKTTHSSAEKHSKGEVDRG